MKIYFMFWHTVHGEWGTWGNWSECSTTCGDGEHMRVRLCDSPAPDNGGSECVGEMTDTIPCNSTDCPCKYESPMNKMYLLTCAPNKDSSHPVHLRSLIWVCVVLKLKLCVLGYQKCSQQRFWPCCARAQADLNLHWAHMPEGIFFLSWFYILAVAT